jgi:DNA-binding MurR/RpiR family transcriptional regulator
MKRAIDFLDEILANGPVNQSVVKQRAEEAGISTTTLNRAKQRCGRNSKRISKGLTVWL